MSQTNLENPRGFEKKTQGKKNKIFYFVVIYTFLGI